MAAQPLCNIDGCDKVVRSKNATWCDAHYKRWRKYADPTAGRAMNGEALRYLESVAYEYDGDDCLIWPFYVDGHGYGQISIGGKNKIVSRLVCEKFNGPPPTQKHEAAHSCGRGHEGCVAGRHLSWKTRTQNFADKVEHGTQFRGETHPNSKLTEDDVRKIRALEGKMLQREIAEMFGVKRMAISKIHRGKLWGWLE